MDEDIRNPDKSYHEQLINDFEFNNEFNQNNQIEDELEKALNESKMMYEEQKNQKELINYNKELFKKLDIQFHYLLLSKDESINFFIECFNIEKDRFIHLEKENIQLFKSHYDYLKKLLEDLYEKPLKLKRNSKIDAELYIYYIVLLFIIKFYYLFFLFFKSRFLS